jgi:glutamate racemase
MKIGIYDSGVGGLSVLNTLRHAFPHEHFVYFADTAHLPYGNKSPEQIIAYTRHIVSWFQNTIHADVIIAACNTSSALAIETVQAEFPVPIIGTIRPMVQQVLSQTSYQKIGILATEASVRSRAHEKIFRSAGFSGHIRFIPCPEFVPLIEAPTQDLAQLTHYAKIYLEPFITEQLDTLLYGCTHYPLIHSIIEPLLPSTLQYLNPAEYIAQTLHGHLKDASSAAGSVTFHCSGDSEAFMQKIQTLG